MSEPNSTSGAQQAAAKAPTGILVQQPIGQAPSAAAPR